jgi:Zn finger protein HypA/HybF involved in hydrogenase expression
MAEVLAFKPKEPEVPHITGEAHCLACLHVWVSVAPAGAVWLECPNCKAEKGLMRFKCLYEKRPHWHCNCGNSLFHVTSAGYYCPNCGDWQTGF